MTNAPQQKSSRRMGPTGSDNWHAMLDSAEAILREEGHAALTSRNIAERIGVKQRLVYYYFQTMDELVIEMFRRSSERELSRLRAASNSTMPVRNIWDVCIHTTDARLIAEFMALAPRIEGLQKEVIRFIEESRAIQVAAIAAALDRVPQVTNILPPGLAILATSIALSLTREGQLGLQTGHKEILAAIETFLDTVEPV